MKRFFDFNGRASRTEFWITHVLAILFVIITAHFTDKIFRQLANPIFFEYLLLVVFLIPLIAIVSVTVRRFHDLGKPGTTYFYFIIPNFVALFIRIFFPPLIPLAAILVLGTGVYYLIYISKKSQEKFNQYGPNPNNEKNKN